MLHINDLSFSFPSHPVLKNLSLSLQTGEIGTLIGPSGSGKSTLLKVLTGTLMPQNGTLEIASLEVPEAYRQVSYMMQEDLMLPWRTILDNLMLVGELGKHPVSNDIFRIEAREYLQEMGLNAWENAYPHELSGGMRQRVSLARVLLQKRPLLLLDEPFASMDVSLRLQMHALLHEIRNRHGTTMLMVTHDFRDALSLSDRIFLLNDGAISHEWKISDAMRKSHTPELHQILEEMGQAMGC